MSRRQRARSRIDAGPAGPVRPQRGGVVAGGDDPVRSTAGALRPGTGERPATDAPPARPGDGGRGDPPAALAAARSVATALLPVRLFFGGTFLYAGLDKLLDPRFIDATSAASIQAQMRAFTTVSPLGPLVRLGEPFAVPIGLAIALLEIAIGLGALSGLAFRAAAVAGAGLSLLFFLTASWATRPYYFGADLPYAAGWISLAIAGHGGLLVSRRLLEWAGGSAAGRAADPGSRGQSRPGGRPRGRRGPVPAPTDRLPLRDRRTVLQAGVLGVFALVVASFAVPFRRAGATSRGDDEGTSGSAGSPSGSSPDLGASAAPGSSSGPAAAGGSTIAVARIADLAKNGARAFTVPFSAPAPLPAGDPAVIVKLANGRYVAYDAVCTHAGCTVQWDQAARLLFCPCHGATFDPAHEAVVVGDGPTNQPLAALPIVVDPATGTISLTA